MWKQYNFDNTSKVKIKLVLAYLLLVALFAFILTGCSKNNEPTIYYDLLQCSCPNPTLDIANKKCICES